MTKGGKFGYFSSNVMTWCNIWNVTALYNLTDCKHDINPENEWKSAVLFFILCSDWLDLCYNIEGGVVLLVSLPSAGYLMSHLTPFINILHSFACVGRFHYKMFSINCISKDSGSYKTSSLSSSLFADTTQNVWVNNCNVRLYSPHWPLLFTWLTMRVWVIKTAFL